MRKAKNLIQTIRRPSTNLNQMEGVLFVNKPSGITSHDVVNHVRKLTGVKRVGHSGTLDPLATGLLIILIGRNYTRQQAKFLKKDKEYIVTGRLGLITNTYDIEGRVVEKKQWSQIRNITKEDIKKVLKQFKGEIEQVVPPFSAVKVMGKKLYNEARKGKVDTKKLPKRTVVIYDLVLTDFRKDKAKKNIYFTLKTRVSSGTYIRSLIHDIGKAIGVGATVIELVRVRIGEISLVNAVEFSSLASFSDVRRNVFN